MRFECKHRTEHVSLFYHSRTDVIFFMRADYVGHKISAVTFSLIFGHYFEQGGKVRIQTVTTCSYADALKIHCQLDLFFTLYQ